MQRLHTSISCSLALAAFALVAWTPIKAAAAVRVCKPAIKTGVAIAATELDAKKAALDAWKKSALEHGAGYDSWRIAANNRLICGKAENAHHCVAIGAPCIIRHVPPSSSHPRREGLPPRGGSAI